MAQNDKMADKGVPDHIQQTIDAIAEIHTKHLQQAGRAQRTVERAVRWVARPRSIAALSLSIVLWVGLNLYLKSLGRAFDPPPFQLLQGIGTVVAIYVTILILITAQREKEIANHREQLALQLAILSEQKSAKIIQLLEEARADNPLIDDREDEEAKTLSEPTDLGAVLHAIKDKDVLSEDPDEQPE
jgi:uncharacterized membrane protein